MDSKIGRDNTIALIKAARDDKDLIIKIMGLSYPKAVSNYKFKEHPYTAVFDDPEIFKLLFPLFPIIEGHRAIIIDDAVRKDSLEVLEFLFENGVNYEEETETHYTFLDRAGQKVRDKFFHLYKFPTDREKLNKKLSSFVHHHDFFMVEKYLEHGADPNHVEFPDENRKTMIEDLIHVVSDCSDTKNDRLIELLKDDFKIAELLIKKGGSVFTFDLVEKFLIEKGRQDLLDLLIKNSEGFILENLKKALEHKDLDRYRDGLKKLLVDQLVKMIK